MKKTVAVIGIDGNIGPAMVNGFAKAGYRTLVSQHVQEGTTSQTDKMNVLVSKIRLKEPSADIEVVPSAKEASWEADIIIPTVPYNLQVALASEIVEVVAGKIVVSAINPIHRTLDRLLTPPMTSAAEELAKLLPYSMVVKAFNTTFGLDLDAPESNRQAFDVFVAGNDSEAVSTVLQLVSDVGLKPIYAGNLSVSRTLESMMLLLVGLSLRNHYLKPIGWKVVHDEAEDEGQTVEKQTERIH